MANTDGTFLGLDTSGTGSSGATGASGAGGAGAGAGAGAGGTSPGSGAGAGIRAAGSAGGYYRIARGTPDRAEYGPGVQVGEHDIVTVSPDPNNTGDVLFSTMGADSAKYGPNVRLQKTNTNPRQVRVRNLSEISMYATNIGDGLIIDHQRYS